MDTLKAHFVVNSTYDIHPDDIEVFADAVRPHIKKTQEIPGCIFYTFSFDLVDKNLCHLAEGWADRDVLDKHLESPIFQEAFSKVVDNVRVLGFKGTIYSVHDEAPIKPKRN